MSLLSCAARRRGHTLTRRVVFTAPSQVEVQEAEVAKPTGKQVLVESLASLISTGTELTILTGDFPQGSAWARYGRYPFVAGYSNVGQALEVGPEVTAVKPGDRVASMAPHSQNALVGQEDLAKVPDGISDEEASFHTLAAGVMNSVRLAGVTLGESVAVVGVGLLGQLTILFSRLCGALPVVAIDLSRKRLALARESGATALLQPGADKVEEELARLTSGRMPDLVFEVTGSPKVILWALSLAKRQGKYIQLSSPRGRSEVDFHDEVNAMSRTIIGTHFGSAPAFETPYNMWTRRRNTELFFQLLAAGYTSVKHLVSHRYRLDDAPEAYRMLLKDRTEAMGVVFTYR